MEYHILTPIEILRNWLTCKIIPYNYKVDISIEPYIRDIDVSVITQSYIIYTIYYRKKKYEHLLFIQVMIQAYIIN